MLIGEAIAHVDRSMEDPEPIFVFSADPRARIAIANEGWGRAYEATLGVDFGFHKRGHYGHVMRLGTIDPVGVSIFEEPFGPTESKSARSEQPSVMNAHAGQRCGRCGL
jgi:hypothetical protein